MPPKFFFPYRALALAEMYYLMSLENGLGKREYGQGEEVAIISCVHY